MSSILAASSTWLALVGLFGLLVYYSVPTRAGRRTTKLLGPPRDSFLFGQSRLLRQSQDAPALIEGWASTYGNAYASPAPFGGTGITILDPKAIAHFFANMETVYHLGPLFKIAIENLVGRGVLWSDGESHKRQRKAISPGFSNVKIREYTPIFFDAAYKLVQHWDDLYGSQLQSEGTFSADLQKALNSISLDSIGLAGFSHDFESLAGKRNDIVDSFDQMAEKGVDPLDVFLVLLSPAFPILHRIPTKRHRIVNRMNSACGVLARRLLQDNRTEKDADRGDRSIMGLLIRAEKSSGVSMSEEEVIAQMKTLMVAGYETTAASMTWMFIELCRHPELQTQLREELLETYPSSDPTYEDLVSQTVLPWLDAVVHESLRLHPALHETPRTAIKDDVLPLSMPITLPDGTTTDRVFIAKGQTVVVPLLAINQSVTFWGEDAKKFRPSRWIEGMSDGKAQELLAYRHIMTFIDGPKTCLGKSFAVLEMKAVLSVLIRKYVFDLPNGPETKIGKQAAIILRPKVEGEKGTRVPMKIRRVEE